MYKLNGQSYAPQRDIIYAPQRDIIYAPQMDLVYAPQTDNHMLLKWTSNESSCVRNGIMRSPNGHGIDFIQHLHLLQSHLCPTLCPILLITSKRSHLMHSSHETSKSYALQTGHLRCASNQPQRCPHKHLKLP